MTRWPWAVLLATAAVAAHAGKPHEHGAAKLDVAIDAGRVTLLLEMPLDSLVGFEREPRTDAERATAAAAIDKLRAPATLFRIDPAAGCTPGAVDLKAASLGLGGGAAKDGHDDLDASFEFVCKDGARAGFVEVGLFDAFPRLARVDVQTATRKGQLKATLKRGTTRVPLAR